jgi:acyl-CoA synthetase (NDP forming)
MSFYLGDYEAINKAAKDPYIVLRDPYIQYRKRLVERSGPARDSGCDGYGQQGEKGITMSRIQVMFNPKTIALIGASEKGGAVGRTILENLLRSKGRKIFPVNLHTSKVLDRESYPTIAALPEHVDLAVIATPARSVPGVVEECGQAGVEGVVIISAGFKEIGEEGTRLENEIDRIRKKYGMRIMGPNCLGFVRPVLGLNATFLWGQPSTGKYRLHLSERRPR